MRRSCGSAFVIDHVAQNDIIKPTIYIVLKCRAQENEGKECTIYRGGQKRKQRMAYPRNAIALPFSNKLPFTLFSLFWAADDQEFCCQKALGLRVFLDTTIELVSH